VDEGLETHSRAQPNSSFSGIADVAARYYCLDDLHQVRSIIILLQLHGSSMMALIMQILTEWIQLHSMQTSLRSPLDKNVDIMLIIFFLQLENLLLSYGPSLPFCGKDCNLSSSNKSIYEYLLGTSTMALQVLRSKIIIDLSLPPKIKYLIYGSNSVNLLRLSHLDF
jgi:hypothetical protein